MTAITAIYYYVCFKSEAERRIPMWWRNNRQVAAMGLLCWFEGFDRTVARSGTKGCLWRVQANQCLHKWEPVYCDFAFMVRKGMVVAMALPLAASEICAFLASVCVWHKVTLPLCVCAFVWILYMLPNRAGKQIGRVNKYGPYGTVSRASKQHHFVCD